MDVNAIWAPHALDAMARVLDALRTMGLLSDGVVRTAAPRGDASALARYVRDPASLRTAVDRWRGAERHFVVRLTADELRERIRRRMAALPEGGARVLVTRARRRRAPTPQPFEFLALSLDANGQPIGVANSDVATRLFLGDVGRAAGAARLQRAGGGAARRADVRAPVPGRTARRRRRPGGRQRCLRHALRLAGVRARPVPRPPRRLGAREQSLPARHDAPRAGRRRGDGAGRGRPRTDGSWRRRSSRSDRPSTRRASTASCGATSCAADASCPCATAPDPTFSSGARPIWRSATPGAAGAE